MKSAAKDCQESPGVAQDNEQVGYPQTGIAEFPQEILGEIFKHIVNIIPFRRVSKGWKQEIDNSPAIKKRNYVIIDNADKFEQLSQHPELAPPFPYKLKIPKNNKILEKIESMAHCEYSQRQRYQALLAKVKEVDASHTDIRDVSMLEHVEELDLGHSKVTDVSALGKVHTLSLDHTDVTNVSALGKVHTLNLSGCCYLQGVSALGNVHTLNLGYSKVTDVSALGKVHTLSLGHTDVTNVSALGKVHTLNLNRTLVRDVSALGKVHTLNLHGSLYLENVFALGNVHTLDLSETEITDVSALGNVHTLFLWHTEVTDVSALGKVHTLNLSGCCYLQDVSALGKVHTLDLSGCSKLRDVSALYNVHTLNLHGVCDEPLDVSALGKVHTLNLGFNKVTDVSELGNVHTLSLEYCKKICDVSALSRVHTLNIHGCGSINLQDPSNLRALSNVSVLKAHDDVKIDLEQFKNQGEQLHNTEEEIKQSEKTVMKRIFNSSFASTKSSNKDKPLATSATSFAFSKSASSKNKRKLRARQLHSTEKQVKPSQESVKKTLFSFSFASTKSSNEDKPFSFGTPTSSCAFSKFMNSTGQDKPPVFKFSAGSSDETPSSSIQKISENSSFLSDELESTLDSGTKKLESIPK